MATSCTSPPFVLEISSFDNEKSRHSAKINDHFFNHALTLILPEINAVPKEIEECFTDQMSYKLHQLPVYRLLDTAFICAFVKRGSIYIMSCGQSVETHDCVAVTPNGELVLHLTKDSYQELGLTAVPQTHTQRKMDIFVVKINLVAENFHPGKKNYDKALQCLKRQGLKLNFLASWVPHNVETCSSSICLYFAGQCERVERMEMATTSRVLTSVPCPKVEPDHPEGHVNGCHYQRLFEWMGAMACDVNSLDNDPDNYSSSFTCPRPSVNCPRCCVVQVRGFLTPNLVNRVLKALRNPKSVQPTSIPASMTVHGFSDSPVRRNSSSHKYYIGGSSVYSFVILPENKYWLFTAYT